MRLPKKHRFVVFMPNDSPLVIPEDDPGTYEIDLVPLVKDPVFPMLVTVVRARDTHLFESMTKERAASVLHSAVVAAAAPGAVQQAAAKPPTVQ